MRWYVADGLNGVLVLKPPSDPHKLLWLITRTAAAATVLGLAPLSYCWIWNVSGLNGLQCLCDIDTDPLSPNNALSLHKAINTGPGGWQCIAHSTVWNSGGHLVSIIQHSCSSQSFRLTFRLKALQLFNIFTSFWPRHCDTGLIILEWMKLLWPLQYAVVGTSPLVWSLQSSMCSVGHQSSSLATAVCSGGHQSSSLANEDSAQAATTSLHQSLHMSLAFSLSLASLVGI